MSPGVASTSHQRAASRTLYTVGMLLKAFQYRLYPTKKQQRLLERQLEECRWLWNTLLAGRKQAWEERQETLDYYEQKAALPDWKSNERPSLKEVHSQVLQDVVLRLKKAFDAFFRRLKAGEEPGYPRFKGKRRYDSLTYPQWNNGVSLSASSKRLLLSKIGNVKLVYHRPLEDAPKTATIRRTATGKWYVTIACEWEPTPLPPTGRDVGVDVGLSTFATCSDGQTIPTPRFLRQEERALAKAQRKHQQALDAHKAIRATLTQQTSEQQPNCDAAVWQVVSQNPEERRAWKARQQRRKVVARTHERIRWRRNNFTHQNSRRLVDHYDLVVVEDLSVREMMANHTLAKSIADVAWRQFLTLIACKAVWADRRFYAVNPAYTSQDCSECGVRKNDLTLQERVYHCPSCGLAMDRDLNAALNLLARGRACLASA
jgi:putative transposase